VKRVLILGAYGMAGHMISMYFKTMLEKYKIFDLCHTNKLNSNSILLDIKDLVGLKKIISNVNPDVIINCVGILNKSASIRVDETIFINSFFPRFLEEYLKNSNTKIIHLSTDCVFSGNKGGYSENDFTDGKDLYAQSKILGEINNSKDLTVRTSIIGPELKGDGIGLFHWFMNQENVIKGYSKVIWTGVTTLELAICLDKMIEQNLIGLYNLSNKIPINKYDLLSIIKNVFNKNITIYKDDKIKCDKSLISCRKDFEHEVPDYENMIIKLKNWMVQNKQIYSQYLF
jgi:dTDP-4-dehydrorhamnose reductase